MPGLASMSLSQLSAEELARQAQAGSSDALNALMGRYAGALERYLRRRCGNAADAEDISQETMLRVWQNLEKYEPGRPFRPWLFAVARNLAATQHQDRRRDKNTAQMAAPLSEPADPATRLAQKERNDGLWAATRQFLGARQYAALWLRYGREMSIEQVARAMGLTQTHVKVTLFRARRKLLRSADFQRRIREEE